MDIFKKGVFALAAAFAAACTGAMPLKTANGVSFYYGQVSYYSPDGRLPYNSAEAVMKREILDNGEKIIETVTQPGIAPGMRPMVTVTELRRRGKTLVFDASGDGGAFSGAVTFNGPELGAWRSEIKFRDGGTLAGSGELSAAGLKTSRNREGAGRPMLITEDLKPVTEREYTLRAGGMQPVPGAE